ncbi:terminus macrodomain insulation protein YfbV [Algibacillus agarilyticus]|uniref:terminus macrodomain insulation protein YfbV n=1 Tax=Algibacillus agarilyticus TaxID=2234133 RepID=UPI000DCF968C|nr:terminus macrodomain insulation protein YfbV [Algibacillus agarilyticus]
MKKSLIETIQNGREYITEWPVKPELYGLFPECRVIKATQFSLLILPLLAVISFTLQFVWLGEQFIPQALATSLLILSMPIQGYIWLGNRANQTLPLSLLTWYKELETKLAVEGVQVKCAQAKPRYFELACLLNQGYKKLDSVFMRKDAF